MCFKNFDQSKLNNLRCYVPQSLCSFVAKARVKCQFQWLHFLSPNFSFFLITQQSTQWMQRKIACQNYTQKMDSLNRKLIKNRRRLTQSWVLNTYIFLWFVFPSQGYSKTSCFHMFHVKKVTCNIIIFWHFLLCSHGTDQHHCHSSHAFRVIFAGFGATPRNDKYFSPEV